MYRLCKIYVPITLIEKMTFGEDLNNFTFYTAGDLRLAKLKIFSLHSKSLR